jgi:hypothetical protein
VQAYYEGKLQELNQVSAARLATGSGFPRAIERARSCEAAARFRCCGTLWWKRAVWTTGGSRMPHASPAHARGCCLAQRGAYGEAVC